MAHQKSADEVKREHLETMGPSLGPLYHVIYDDVVWTHAKWLEYRKLFAESPERVDLLNRSAAFFFVTIQTVLWDDILLSLARLVDPPRSRGGKATASLNALAPTITDTALANDVRRRVKEASDYCSFARDWRNRRIAHRDRASALDAKAEPLEPASRDKVEIALESIRRAINRVHGYYFDSEIVFDLFIAPSDAEALVHRLRRADEA